MGSFMEVFRGTKLDGILLLAKVFSEKIISLFPQPYLLVHLFNSLPPSPWCGRGGTQASPVEACPPVSPAVGRHVALCNTRKFHHNKILLATWFSFIF
jgi:hypothetical protein